MSDTAWLKELKAGDEVILYLTDCPMVQRIEQVTDDTVQTKMDTFSRADGYMLHWRRRGKPPYIVKPTDELRQEAKKEEILFRLQQRRWEALPLSVLEAVAAVLEGHEGSLG